MDARSYGVGLVGATLIFAAGCSGSNEPAANDLQGPSSPTAQAGADRTEGATDADGELAAEDQDEGDGDYGAISGTWTGDLIWAPHGVDPSAGAPYRAELQLEQEAEPGSPVGRLVERGEPDGEVVCAWTVFAVKASAPTYEVAPRGGSPAGECEGGSMELEWDEARDVLVVDGRWPKGSWDGELTREAGS